jgi:hypothetical protein
VVRNTRLIASVHAGIADYLSILGIPSNGPRRKSGCNVINRMTGRDMLTTIRVT